MLKLKLMPVGKKHSICYRIVVAEETSKLSGNTKEIVGTYDPSDKKLILDQAAVSKWLKQGVQPTPTVKRLLDQK